MEIAWRQKFLFGGAMRQAGMIAAAALYALDNHVALIAVDHERARRLAEGWHAEGVPVEIDRVETNFVQIDTSRLDIPRAEALGLLREAGVGLSPTYTPSHIRAVTHMDLDDGDIDRALELVPAALGAHVHA
jgi:threonine aldolase